MPASLSRLRAAVLGLHTLWEHAFAWQRQSPFDMAPTPNAPCACDCCVAERSRDTNAPSTSSSSLVSCMPRASADVPGGGAAEESGNDGGCSGLCTIPSDSWAAFASKTGEVDYARYCLQSCRPASADRNILCADADAVSGQDVAQPPPIALGASNVNVSLKARQPMSDEEGAAALVIAKGEMERAKGQAIAAGQAAKVARESYENVVKSSKFMSVTAANETVEDIKRAAGEQARDAMQLRMKYEKDARMNALKVAGNITSTYENKRQEFLAMALKWDDVSKEFDASAEASLSTAEDIELGPKAKTWEMQLRHISQIEEAKAEADAFTAKARDAKLNAERLRNMSAFDPEDIRTAAVHAMAKSMPPDVAPPPLPPPMPTAPPV